MRKIWIAILLVFISFAGLSACITFAEEISSCDNTSSREKFRSWPPTEPFWPMSKIDQDHVKFIVDYSSLPRGQDSEVVETYFGDAIYLVAYVKNEAEAPLEGIVPIEYFGGRGNIEDSKLDIVFYCKPLGLKYCIYSENAESNPMTVKTVRDVTPPAPIAPAEQALVAMRRVDIPSLDEMENAFWEVAEKLLSSRNGIQCELEVAFYPQVFSPYVFRKTIPVFLYRRASFADVLDQRKRAKYHWITDESITQNKKELQLLKEWHDGTDSKLFPIRKPELRCRQVSSKGWETLYAIPKQLNIHGEMVSEIDLLKTNITRKPMYPNAPTTVEGWRELEEQFSPSTVRDEIQLRRMIFERALAVDDEDHEQKHQEIVAWLMTLPYAQRTIMANDFDIQLPEEEPEVTSAKE